ncbi:MAG: hypothetical protein QOH96_215 [Blastocatellia bacterium]|nr:hypothetical protein [Blastocatellia bacterium]
MSDSIIASLVKAAARIRGLRTKGITSGKEI